MAGRKVFVGSLPDGCQEETVREEFAKYGQIDEIFVKTGAEPGRQFAFVTYANAEQALAAKEATDRVLTFPGAGRACDVMIARNQGKFGQGDGVAPPAIAAASVTVTQPKKVFVGSLPDSITEAMLREEFSKYGKIVDVFVKNGCESGKQWAFVSYESHEEANLAKTSTDRTLTFLGSERPCEVMLARNQGMNGQEPLSAPTLPAPMSPQGPVKIFVGSLPDSVNETILRAEFSKYGQITDVHLKLGCESGKQWAFVTFATHQQAQHAKDATDRTLVIQGDSTPCEVMFAKNQGRNGQDPMAGSAVAGDVVLKSGIPGQPPPPMTPMPNQYGGWFSFFTSTGLPYYHNYITGVTQWECPYELQYAMAQTQAAQAAAAQAAHVAHAAHAAQAAHAQAAMYGAMYAVQPIRYVPY